MKKKNLTRMAVGMGLLGMAILPQVALGQWFSNGSAPTASNSPVSGGGVSPVPTTATCFGACNQGAMSQNRGANIANQSNDTRQRSHNFGNNNTAILGDVNIRVGHEHVMINGFGSGKDNVIDASITNIINMGDFAK